MHHYDSSGALANMKERGIKWVFIGSVDNALLKMVDTTLLGMAIDKGYANCIKVCC